MFLWGLGSSLLQAKPFYAQHDEGWFWYQPEEKKELRTDTLKDKSVPSTPSQKIHTAQEKVK